MPVFPVILKTPTDIKDISINNVRVPGFAFKDTMVKLVMNISALGYAGKYVTVNLISGDGKKEILMTKKHLLKDKDIVEYAGKHGLILVTQDQKPAELAELTGVKYVLISNALIAKIADEKIKEKYKR